MAITVEELRKKNKDETLKAAEEAENVIDDILLTKYRGGEIAISTERFTVFNEFVTEHLRNRYTDWTLCYDDFGNELLMYPTPSLSNGMLLTRIGYNSKVY